MLFAYRPAIGATPHPSHRLSIFHRSSFVTLKNRNRESLKRKSFGIIEDGGSQGLGESKVIDYELPQLKEENWQGGLRRILQASRRKVQVQCSHLRNGEHIKGRRIGAQLQAQM